jgi:hypothetical protein
MLSAIEQWYDYVANHQTCQVTIPSDTLPAISAIAFDITNHIKCHYYCGIWIEDAAPGLAWTINGLGSSLATWYAPSWSWASLEYLEDFTLIQQNLDRKWLYERDGYSLKAIHHP